MCRVKTQASGRCSGLQKGDRLHTGNIETLAATHILAGRKVIGAHHIGLRLGEPGTVALIGAAAQLGLFPADEPPKLVLVRLAAVRARQQVRALLRFFVEKVTLFHTPSIS